MIIQRFRIERSSVLSEVVQIFPEIHSDWRGDNVVLFKNDEYSFTGVEFCQDNLSVSSHGVLRGLHGDDVTDKLISVVFGRVYLVVVDIRPNSPTRGEWDSFVLDDRFRNQVFIPRGFLNGHLCLSSKCGFFYKLSSYYVGPSNQITRAWNDPEFGIWWPIRDPKLSTRDDFSCKGEVK